MSVGTGIFLASLFLGTIALYVATKDRWKWRKLIVRMVVAGVAIGAVVSASFYGWIAYTERPTKPVAQTEFWGIALDATKGDIKFKKGEPDFVHVFSGDNAAAAIWVYGASPDTKLELQKKPKDLMPWDTYVVGFRGEELRRIGYAGIDSYKGIGLNEIRIGASLEEIVGKLGKPTYVSISQDELTRIASFEHLNSYFELRQNRVTELGIYNRKFGPPSYTKERAK